MELQQKHEAEAKAEAASMDPKREAKAEAWSIIMELNPKQSGGTYHFIPVVFVAEWPEASLCCMDLLGYLDPADESPRSDLHSELPVAPGS